MSYFFLCGLSRPCVNQMTKSRKDAKDRKVGNRFIHHFNSRNRTLIYSRYLIHWKEVCPTTIDPDQYKLLQK